MMRLMHGLGAYAETVVTEESLLARVPDLLFDVAAAALPISVLTSLHVSGDRTKVINYAPWRSQKDCDAMLANPEARVLTQQTANIAKSYDPVTCNLRRVYRAE